MVQTSSRSTVSARHPSTPQRKQPSLGLAGLAVGLVVASDLGLPLPGGYLAIDILLVAIGFELARRVRRSDKRERGVQHFRLTTLARIMAPLGLALGLMAGYWGWQGQLDEAKVGELVGSGGLVLNFLTIYGQAGSMALEHLWLIAVIGQFVILLPALMAFGRRYASRDRRAAALVGLAIGVAICRFGLLLTGAAATESIAINTVTRLDGLLLGAAIGICPLASLRGRIPVDLAAPAFAGLLLLTVIAPAQATMPVVTLGLLTPLAIALAALVVVSQAIGSPSKALANTLDNQLLRWLGERAFSIYIWHSLFGFTLHVDQLGTTQDMQDWPGAAVFVVRLVFSLAAAAVSHRYLEVPAMAVAEELADLAGGPPSTPRGGDERSRRRRYRAPQSRERTAMPNAARMLAPIPAGHARPRRASPPVHHRSSTPWAQR